MTQVGPKTMHSTGSKSPTGRVDFENLGPAEELQQKRSGTLDHGHAGIDELIFINTDVTTRILSPGVTLNSHQ